MADAKLTALTAASALAGEDLFYISQGGVSKRATHTQLLTLVGTEYVAKAGGTMTGALLAANGSKTAPGLAFAGDATSGLYWRAGIVLGVAGASKELMQLITSGSLAVSRVAFPANQANDFSTIGATSQLGADGTANVIALIGATETAAQTLRIYGIKTDSSNYERLAISAQQGVGFTIGAETLGTGADNLDIVLTPAGTGKVLVPATSPSLAIAGNPTYGLGWDAASGVVLVHASTKVLTTRTGGLGMPSTGFLAWSQGTIGETLDAGFSRGAAGRVDVTNGTAGAWRDLKLRNLIQTEYHELTEMTAPSAPAANSVRIYAVDNGAGKTKLMALFATGAAQQIAIEP